MTEPMAEPTAVAGTPTGNPPDLDLRRTLIDEFARAMALQKGEYMADLVHGGVSTAHLWVLMKLRSHGELSMSRLAELLGIGLPNVTGLVDRMEERGLVERCRVPDDRRVVHVRLTAEGSRIPETMEGLQRDLMARVLGALDNHALECCLTAIREAIAEADPAGMSPQGISRVFTLPSQLDSSMGPAGGASRRHPVTLTTTPQERG